MKFQVRGLYPCRTLFRVYPLGSEKELYLFDPHTHVQRFDSLGFVEINVLLGLSAVAGRKSASLYTAREVEYQRAEPANTVEIITAFPLF